MIHSFVDLLRTKLRLAGQGSLKLRQIHSDDCLRCCSGRHCPQNSVFAAGRRPAGPFRGL